MGRFMLMKKVMSISAILALILLTACGNVKEGNYEESKRDADSTIAIAYTKAVKDISVQAWKDYRQIEELDDKPVTLFRIEDINRDDVPELIVVICNEPEIILLTEKDQPLLLGVQVFTYEANEVVPIYISPMEYIYNGGQYATFDYENNQFYHYQTYGGGGGYNWDATVIYGENGQLVKDFASMGAGSPDGISPFEVDGSVYEKIQTVNFRETDYEDYEYESELEINSEEEWDAWESRISESSILYREDPMNWDCVYLRADEVSEKTMLSLVKRGTTSIYNSDKCRYIIRNAKIEKREDGAYLTGDLGIEQEYAMYVGSPEFEIIEENVSYKVADGAACFQMFGDYEGKLKRIAFYDNMDVVVLIDDEYVYAAITCFM